VNKSEAKRILYEIAGYHKTSGSELLFKCPVCNHHKHKFSVNLDKNAFKCWVCDYRGRNIRRVVRRFGSYTQLQKWDQATNRVDLERFADLFVERRDEESKERVELPSQFLSLTSKDLRAAAKCAYRYFRSRGGTDDDTV